MSVSGVVSGGVGVGCVGGVVSVSGVVSGVVSGGESVELGGGCIPV